MNQSLKKTLRIALIAIVMIVALAFAALFIIYETKAEKKIVLAPLFRETGELNYIEIYQTFPDGVYKITLDDPAILQDLTQTMERLKGVESAYRVSSREWKENTMAIFFYYGERQLPVFIESIAFGFYTVKSSDTFHYMTRDNTLEKLKSYFNQADSAFVDPIDVPHVDF